MIPGLGVMRPMIPTVLEWPGGRGDLYGSSLSEANGANEKKRYAMIAWCKPRPCQGYMGS